MRIFALLSILTIGCGEPSNPPEVPEPKAGLPATSAEIVQRYRELQRQTAEPIRMHIDLSLLCGNFGQEHIEREHGPHAHRSMHVYMNQEAEQAMKDGATAYPVGAVVVKEKIHPPVISKAVDQPAKLKVEAVAGMIKRAPGYDPANNDWEYFYHQPPAALQSGKLNSCINCHRSVLERDCVFGAWARNSSS